ncbi:MAG: DUF3833 domain-containing protein [Candidatus Thiodiazotropha sp.]
MLFKPMALLTAITLSGCAGADLSRYQSERPVLKLEEYFNGTLVGWGMFQQRDGTVVKRFKVVVEASWEGDHGVLDEQFTFSDGTRQQRIWRLTKTGEDEYTGTADDVVGRARGRISGNALQWAYSLRLPVGGKVYEVTFDDWMYLQEEGVLLNRSVMKKFGFRLGEVLLFFKRRDS